MTEETQALVAELRKIAAANVCDLPNMGDEAHEPPEITWGELDAIGRTADGAAAALTSLARDLATADKCNDILKGEVAAARQERDAALSALSVARDVAHEYQQQGEKLEGEIDAAVRAARAETLRELRAEIAEAKTGLYGEVSGIRALEIIDGKLAAREGQ